MATEDIGAKAKRYFDAIMIVPLEEEFEIVLEQFIVGENLTDDNNIRFSVSIEGLHERYLIVKQTQMGRSSNVEATLNCLTEFDAGILICVGIAAGLSGDVAIGDVCYTGTLIDVTDNSKIRENSAGAQEISLSSTSHYTPRPLVTPIGLDRINPATKPTHLAWVGEQDRIARGLIPNEFTGRSGEKEKIKPLVVREGAIVCGLVSNSAGYNEQLRGIERKVLALETEAGGMFNIAASHGQVPAVSIRGISDYAGMGIDKGIFERETNYNARKVATLNAATFLARQLKSIPIRAYLEKRRATGGNAQPSLLPTPPTDVLNEFLVQQDDEFYLKLRALSPSFALLSKGYRLPMPRIKTVERAGIEKTSRSFMDVQDALKRTDVLSVHIPREYPDSSISWIVARNLLPAQLDEKQLVPCVVEAKHLQRPHVGIDRLAGQPALAIERMPQVQMVFIIDEFDFGSRSRTGFLIEQIKSRPDSKFVVISRSRANTLVNSEFATSTLSLTTELTEISFTEMSHFVQKNFELDVSASEVIAIRLREIFHKYHLFAHPSYFAGIPRNILNGLLQANRRAELIELAVAGYLSFVVAEDKEPVALSRTTREKFLTELAFQTRAKGKTFSEAALTKYAEDFAKRFDFKIAPARFVVFFIEKGILHVEDNKIVFTLKFMEYYLLAKRLIEEPFEAITYFNPSSDGFDYSTFTLYAEMGAAQELVAKISDRLDHIITELKQRRSEGSILLENARSFAFLEHHDRLAAVRQRLQQAEDDVRLNRDQTHEKQALLDLNDRLREEAAARLAEATTAREERKESVETPAVSIWSTAVILLGSGAERLEASVKRELIVKVVTLAELVIEGWGRLNSAIDFAEIKRNLHDMLARNQAQNLETRLETTTEIADIIVDLFEYLYALRPFMSVVTFLCEEARYNVLVESIINTKIDGAITTLIRNLWLCDIDPDKGRRDLRKSVRDLPKGLFIRHAIADQLATRVYWKHWEKEGRLILLQIANDSLKGIGRQYGSSTMKELMAEIDLDEEPVAEE